MRKCIQVHTKKKKKKKERKKKSFPCYSATKAPFLHTVPDATEPIATGEPLVHSDHDLPPEEQRIEFSEQDREPGTTLALGLGTLELTAGDPVVGWLSGEEDADSGLLPVPVDANAPGLPEAEAAGEFVLPLPRKGALL